LYRAQFTAEKVALENIKRGILPPDSASIKYGNVWFDAIGAQMKADIWGLIAPECPKIAAEYAKIDGSVAHQGVGIEGEIYIAAMIANAFKISDIPTLVKISLDLLPQKSEYRNFVELCINIHEKHPNWRDGRTVMLKEFKKIRYRLKSQTNSFYRKLNPLGVGKFLHVLPNAGIITLSLLYGANDVNDPFGRPICLAGMMALDTDCNCGNIGTIMGVIHGEKKIPKKWKIPLNNEFHTYVKGHEDWKISDLALRIAKMGKKIMDAKCPRKKILEE
jgi:ADP-ribosylglycohydrolase